MVAAQTMFKTASPLSVGIIAPRNSRASALRVSAGASGDGARVDKFNKKDIL